MAAYTATQANEVIGTLTNGVKLVMTTYGIAGVGRMRRTHLYLHSEEYLQ